MVECLEGADDVEAFVVLPRGTDSDVARRNLHGHRIKQLSLASGFSDVALIKVTLEGGPSSEEMRPHRISLARPVVGQNCVGLGYPQTMGEPSSYNMTASQGEIEEIHHRRRDNVLSTYPSFRTTGNYLPSMSGGPIFGQNGDVIGVSHLEERRRSRAGRDRAGGPELLEPRMHQVLSVHIMAQRAAYVPSLGVNCEVLHGPARIR
ncbi:trypsin-like peptidase domain-containing protein [Candidatus Mycobacterium methanotrophicum]|uniref:trypsin-like peptidase domain-containing protein n=1 Tax=Candidatus Mycobacterium methanotrophicum TaxID=2943498 RepID=UPI001C55F578